MNCNLNTNTLVKPRPYIGYSSKAMYNTLQAHVCLQHTSDLRITHISYVYLYIERRGDLHHNLISTK